MTKPEIKFDLNLGTLLPIAAMALALAVAWGELNAAVRDIDRRMEQMERSDESGETRLRALEGGQSAMSARMEAILESINELKVTQRETNALLRGIANGAKP